MKRRLCFAIGALATMIGGCGSIVLDPAGTEAQDTGQGGVTSDPNAIAMSWAQSGFEPTDVDPDALILFFSSKPQTCEAPVVLHSFGGSKGCEGGQDAGWQVYMGIPSDLVQPGIVALDDAHLHFVEINEWWCGGGVSGSFGTDFLETFGTLEITSLDATSVSVTLDFESVLPSSDVISGDYVASRCP